MVQVADGPPHDQLAGHAGRGNGRATAVRLKAHLGRAVSANSQKEAREIAAALVLSLADGVRATHEPGVPRVQEVVDESGTVPHAGPVGRRRRSLLATASMHSIT